MRVEARALFAAALPGAGRLTALRAVASAILGCDAALDRRHGRLRRSAIFALLVARLRRCVLRARPRWRLALAGAGADLRERAAAPRPRSSPGDGWRLRASDASASGSSTGSSPPRRRAVGSFTPVGSDGWWPRGGTRSRFDQQPIEATAMILAAAAAYDVDRGRGLSAQRRRPRTGGSWVTTTPGLAVADVVTGGCHDGLSEDHVNVNQGAESTLMWLTARRDDAAAAVAIVRGRARIGHSARGAGPAGDAVMSACRLGHLHPAPGQPHHHGRPAALPRELGLQPGRRTGRR